MGKVYQKSFYLSEKVTIKQLVVYMLETADVQTQLLGNVSETMHELSLSWFILQHDMTIMSLPKENDTIVIETEALCYNQFFTYRAFRIFKDGQLLVSSLVKFAMVDLVERKITRVVESVLQPYKADKLMKAIRMEKVPRIKIPMIKNRWEVVVEHIDLNGHVNNAIYFDWLVLNDERRPKKISIVYDKELLLAETVTLYTKELDMHTQYSLETDDKVACRAKIEWETDESRCED